MKAGQDSGGKSASQGAIPRRYVVMGVSGCGKSEIGARLAERLGCRHIEGDAYHSRHNIQKMAAGIPLDDADREDWLERLSEELALARKGGAGLVLSCSALKRKYRDLLRQGDPDVVFVHLSGPRSLIEERMRVRPNHFMPVSLLDSQFRDLQPLDASETGVVMDVGLPPDELVEKVLECIDKT